ncbi:MAG: hypothetical protein WCI51_14930 [Lentisphaerota bacterium]
MKNFEKLEEMRVSLGINKKEMAVRLGVTPRQYCVWAKTDAPGKYLAIAEDSINGDSARLDRIEKMLERLLLFLKVD